MNILFICSFIFFFFGIYLVWYSTKEIKYAHNIKIEKDQELEEQKKKKQKINKEINDLYNKRTELLSAIEKEKERHNENIEKEKNKLSEQLEIYRQNISNSMERYSDYLEQDYIKVENYHDERVKQCEEEYKNLIQQKKIEFKEVKNQLNDIKNSLSAAVQAQLREREKEENLQFYKLSISPVELEDITKLCSLKIALHNPVILSKLIWTQYFQKQTTEMCNRVFGKKTVCGIYKITNIKTKQCYIGQSINIQDRIKQHIKCGLGIDASATNKLYNAMQSDGVWNYTFELIEKCLREDLDKKEKYWIDMYQSREFGYNTTKGNH